MNAKSSRSHTIFQITVESGKAENGILKVIKKESIIKKSKINLCDLAGSEKVKYHFDMKKAHMSELININ